MIRGKTFIFAVAAALILIVVALAWWSRHPSVADARMPSGQNQPPVVRPGTPVPGPGTTGVAPVPGANTLPPAKTSPTPAAVSLTKEEAMIDLDKTQRMLRDYRTLMKENPVGTNAEIMAALMGKNPRQAMLGPAEGQHLNDKGELIDQWGTPYFFHQLSGEHMEIHSAGPDKIMGTADDVVLP